MHYRSFPLCVFSLVSLATIACGQTTAINLTFANSSNRLQDTGSSGITFSSSGDNLTYSAGPGGTTAANFDGTTGLTASSSPISSAFTIAFWMNTTTPGAGALGMGEDWYEGSGLVDGDLPTATQDWGVSLLGNNIALGIGGPDRTITSSSSVTNGTWVYVTATWDGSSQTATLYIDGVEQAQSTSVPGQNRITSDPFQVGHDPTVGNYYTGALADVQIYTTAFTAGEVESNYDLTAVPEPATCALIAGVGALGFAVWRRRPARA